MIRKAVLCMLVLAACAVYGGCSEEENNPAAPAPTMSGTWDVVLDFPGAIDSIRFVITEANGVLGGSINTLEGEKQLNGTCSSSGQVTLSYDVPQGNSGITARGVFDGNVNAERTALSGTFKGIMLPSGVQVFSAPFTAAKRGTP